MNNNQKDDLCSLFIGNYSLTSPSLLARAVRVVRRVVVARPVVVPVLRRAGVGAGSAPVAAAGVAVRRVRVAGRGVSPVLAAGLLPGVGLPAGVGLAGVALAGVALADAGLLGRDAVLVGAGVTGRAPLPAVATRRRGAAGRGAAGRGAGGGDASPAASSTGTRTS
jgi:hypothetical protein